MSWLERAACRGMDPAIFFPENDANGWLARRTCASCPVAAECFLSGLHEDYGIWGGTDATARRNSRKAATVAEGCTSVSLPGGGLVS